MNDNHNLKIRILGCGSSGGVPRVGCGWGTCDPGEPKNLRSRCSLLVESVNGTRILIDTAPDMRTQLMAAEIERLDAVFYTHAHADQANGIDDLRGFYLGTGVRIPVYADARTLAELERRFDYCFNGANGYPAILDGQVFKDHEPVGDLIIRPLKVVHGAIDAYGFRIGNMAYFPDVSEIPEEIFAHLQGLSLLVIDALRYTPHPSHIHLDRALEYITRIKPARAVLTNMFSDLDYRTLQQTLPERVAPAYDGMELFID